MKARVYLETTVISYYTNRLSKDIITAARQKITRDWWKKERNNFDIYISFLVHQEAGDGDSSAASRRLEVLQGIPLLPVSNEAEELAKYLISKSYVPKKSEEDALHIALSAIHGMDYLLTWNFTHINNEFRKSQINGAIKRAGYACPTICSPEELLGDIV